MTTKAMGKGSTQHQHLVQTEVPKKLLEEWLALWSEHHGLRGGLRVQLRPSRAGSEVLELGIYGQDEEKHANVVFAPIHDRRGRSILSVRDQNTYAEALRQKRLMTLIHLWLVHRFKADSVHYVTPTEDNQLTCMPTSFKSPSQRNPAAKSRYAFPPTSPPGMLR